MMKTAKRILMMVMVFALLITTVNPVTAEAAKKKKPTLSKKKITLVMTNKKPHPSATIKVKNAHKNGEWSIRLNKSKKSTKRGYAVAIKSLTNKRFKFSAMGATTGTIEYRVNNKTVAKCKLVIKDKRTKESTAKKPADKDKADDENSDDAESKPDMAFICRSICKDGTECGYKIPITVPGGTDEERAALDAHLEEHRKKGEKTSYFF